MTSISLEQIWNRISFRLFKPRETWHNRHFDSRYQARETTPGQWNVTWRGDPVKNRPLAELARLPHSRVCHIIASGPSLAALREPARLFRDFTICMNGSFRLAQQVNARCDLYLTLDGGFIRRRFADFKTGVETSRHLLVDHLMLFFLLERDPELGRRLNPFLYDDPNRPYRSHALLHARSIVSAFRVGEDFIPDPRTGGLLICKHPLLGIARSSSVICSALQAAWLMGFEEVRIYGMDLGGPGRFYRESSKAEPTRLERDYEEHLLPWFQAFAAQCVGPSFRVFNCSTTSRLPAEILPRLDPNAL